MGYNELVSSAHVGFQELIFNDMLTVNKEMFIAMLTVINRCSVPC